MTLEGERLVRLIYVDESGTSNNGKEPWLIVAGIIVDGDKDVRPLERYLDNLAVESVAPELLPEFWFHATGLYSGDKFFKRGDPKSIEILRDLASLPQKFGLPVIWGAIRKADFQIEKMKMPMSGKQGHFQTFDKGHLLQVAAYNICMSKAEEWIAKNHPADLARVFWEDGSGVKPLIKHTHKFLFMDPCPIQGLPNMPAKHLSGPAYFVEKKDDRLMQLADVCAFCIKKKISGGGKHIDELNASLEPQLLSGPVDPVADGRF